MIFITVNEYNYASQLTALQEIAIYTPLFYIRMWVSSVILVQLITVNIVRMLYVCAHLCLLCACSWVPVYADKKKRLAIMSIGFLLQSRDDAVVWRGPKKNGETHTWLVSGVFSRVWAECHHSGQLRESLPVTLLSKWTLQALNESLRHWMGVCEASITYMYVASSWNMLFSSSCRY